MFIRTIKSLFPVFCIMLALLFTGCQKDPFEQAGDTIVDTYKRVEVKKDKVNLRTLKSSINQYRALNGRLPDSIQEIAEFTGIKINTALYDYNPQTGELRFK